MQFLMSKEELEIGCQLIESFVTDELTFGEVYAEQGRLNKQGFFTVIKELDVDDDEEMKFKIEVYQRKEPFVQVG